MALSSGLSLSRGARADDRAGEVSCRSASTSNEFFSSTCERRETINRRASERGRPKQITHRQLRAFTLVAEAGSFSLASQRLHLTPSAVSLLVRELEATLDFQLLERTTRRVLLTPAGCVFMPAAPAVLNELQRAEIRARDVRNANQATVRVAAPPVNAAALLPRLADMLRDPGSL